MPEFAVPARSLRFAPEAIQKHVDAALLEIPEGKTTALIGYYDLSGTWRVGWAWRQPGSAWSFGATIGKDLVNGNVTGGLLVRFTK